jgi:hypothetical protein
LCLSQARTRIILCLSQARTRIIFNAICRGILCFQCFEVKDTCLFCWYLWCCWSSLKTFFSYLQVTDIYHSEMSSTYR